ncbi:2OG-Fe(II) oxygenase [Sphingopyxis fribergensis]|uniref:2OG-Fe(II) oxygenase n=1 Tax=Sphingopyxis fribergensis TaxID=1515612 RepID=A0A0A7PE37_9SPHN|nr:2OG-Fe(II) oxygenase [Sphingopyxis fribergensis]AJA07498.1 2OG-Fe(II) oxygenase [Sphingopyxis fribergensis]
MKNIWEVWTSALSLEECDDIIAKAEAYPVKTATVGFEQSNRVDEKLRESSVRWLPPHREPALVQRIMGFVRSSNRTNFGFDIVEPFDIQFTEYHGSRNGKYDWHHDVRLTSSAPYDRKLSVVIQLSHRDDYEGGEFEFSTVAHPGTVFEPRGSMLIFPSFLQHRVLPVTKGTRHSLVTWIEGPQWR